MRRGGGEEGRSETQLIMARLRVGVVFVIQRPLTFRSELTEAKADRGLKVRVGRLWLELAVQQLILLAVSISP